MPIGTPQIKVDSVNRFGGDKVVVHIEGENFDEARDLCIQYAEENDLYFVPPFDDPYVIAGQGTIGIEILQKIPEPDAVFVQIGGGGLAAGISEYIKGKNNPPAKTKIIGVECVGQDAMAQSLAAGEPVTLDSVDPFADGTAVRRPGDETFRVCNERLEHDIVLASVDEICAAIKDIYDGTPCSLRQVHTDGFTDTRSIAEPSGALALAGLKNYIAENKSVGKKFVAIVSGANMDFVRLRFVAERAELGEGREALLSIVNPNRSEYVSHLPPIPKYELTFFCLQSVEELYKIINRNVTEYLYRYDASGRRSHVMLSFNVREGSVPSEDVEEVLRALNKNGDRAKNISNNGLAKNHVRYMVGGTEPVPYERVFRFGRCDRYTAWV